MKLAAILALIIAVVAGAWAINDYQINEEVRRDFARQGITRVFFRTDAGENKQLDVRGMSAYNEQHDAIIGALSVASFIGSSLMFLFLKRRVV